MRLAAPSVPPCHVLSDGSQSVKYFWISTKKFRSTSHMLLNRPCDGNQSVQWDISDGKNSKSDLPTYIRGSHLQWGNFEGQKFDGCPI